MGGIVVIGLWEQGEGHRRGLMVKRVLRGL